MGNLTTEIEQKTKTHISQGIGIAVVFLLGAGAVAAMLFFNNKLTKDSSTATITGTTKTSNSVVVDNTNSPLPTEIVSLSAAEFQAKLTASKAAASSDVSIAITSPTEGSIATGNDTVTATLTDPSHKAAGVMFGFYNDRYGIAFCCGGSVDTTPPYTKTWNYGLYPSGEYRYVAMAVAFDTTKPPGEGTIILASTDVMVTISHDCYYLAYQDMTLAAQTTSVVANRSFTLNGTLKNNMRGACQHIYSLTTVNFAGLPPLLPNGWTATVTPETMDMGIGETRNFTLTVNVPGNTAPGKYQVGVKSTRQGTGFRVTKTVDVTVVSGSGGGTPIVVPVD